MSSIEAHVFVHCLDGNTPPDGKASVTEKFADDIGDGRAAAPPLNFHRPPHTQKQKNKKEKLRNAPEQQTKGLLRCAPCSSHGDEEFRLKPGPKCSTAECKSGPFLARFQVWRAQSIALRFSFLRSTVIRRLAVPISFFSRQLSKSDRRDVSRVQ